MLVDKGHRVYAGVLDPDRDPAVDKLSASGAHVVHLDVTDDNDVALAIDTILRAEGRIDALVNNAAFGPIGALEDTRTSTFEHTLAVNLVGPHRLVRRVLPSMRRRAQGVIVNVGSINGFVADPMLGAYSASKAGLAMYTEILAYEVGHFGIRVHLLEPGGFATGIHQRAPWEPGGLDPENPYYPLQVACWGDPDAWGPDAFGDPDIVARALVDAIEDPSTPLFLAVAADTAEERCRIFGLDEGARRARMIAQLPEGMAW
jgi:NAD(P)-dependent dehydrogenase (short-subunit alcohol dehydrogenase family)